MTCSIWLPCLTCIYKMRANECLASDQFNRCQPDSQLRVPKQRVSFDRTPQVHPDGQGPSKGADWQGRIFVLSCRTVQVQCKTVEKSKRLNRSIGTSVRSALD